MKVIEKLQNAEKEGKVVFSFEYFPPKTEGGVENLFDRMDQMVEHQPSFCDITWGAGGSTADLTLDISNKMQNMICVETMMHLTCTNMPVEKIDHALTTIKANGIQNVLALRGDPPHGQDKFVQVEGGFACALDLVKHIRSKYGDYFGITVAGYPEAHTDMIKNNMGATEEDYQKDLAYLKSKVDAGADLIITQLFYDTDIYLKFEKDCRQIGIKCPIVPGIMPINTYASFIQMVGFSKTKIPSEITAALEPIKDNEEAVRAYGIHLGTEMCKKILAHGIKTLHLYMLNMDKSALDILANLGLIDMTKIRRPLPWVGWEPFPHGRLGDTSSPAYGALNDYQNMDGSSDEDKNQKTAKVESSGKKRPLPDSSTKSPGTDKKAKVTPGGAQNQGTDGGKKGGGPKTFVSKEQTPSNKGQAPEAKGAVAAKESPKPSTTPGSGKKIGQVVHLDDRPLTCPWKGCEKTFKWAWERTEHIRVHTKERPYICKTAGCGKTFRFVSDFSCHKRKTGCRHNNVFGTDGGKKGGGPNTFVSKKQTPSNKGQIPKAKVAVAAKESPKPSTAPGSGKKIGQVVHLDDRPLTCPWKGCEKTFKWAWERTEHIRVHTKERPYVCKTAGCGKTFRFVSDFSRHKRKTGHLRNSIFLVSYTDFSS